MLKHLRTLVTAVVCCLSCAALPSSAQAQAINEDGVKHAAWVRNANIYEMDVRNFTQDGTLSAAERQLPRLHALGVDIVWLMPIHPVGVFHRKGILGSPYSVRDYRAVNPDFGTLADLRHFVKFAHALGMHVILDWVANHSAVDNPLVTLHPDWYERDDAGKPRSTLWFDWSDTLEFNYSNASMRKYMIDSMTYWVREADVDGFRCDTAGFVPIDFWNLARRRLDAIKPVFMLAESDTRDLHMKAFDASYANQWDAAMIAIAHHHADANSLRGFYAFMQNSWPNGAIRMMFVTNQDRDLLDGSVYKRYGAALESAVVLTVAAEGMPLLYNGQEAGPDRRIATNEKYPEEHFIVRGADRYGELYRQLFALKHSNRALWNAPWGGRVINVDNDVPAKVFSFVRRQGADRVFAIFNLSDSPQRVALRGGLYQGRYQDFSSGVEVRLDDGANFEMPAWGWKLFTTRSASAFNVALPPSVRRSLVRPGRSPREFKSD